MPMRVQHPGEVLQLELAELGVSLVSNCHP